MVLPWCYHGLTMYMLLPWCYHDVIMVLPWCYHGVTMYMLLPWCYHDVTMMLPWLPWCYHGFTMVTHVTHTSLGPLYENHSSLGPLHVTYTSLGPLHENHSENNLFYLEMYGAIVGTNTVMTLLRAFLFAHFGVKATSALHSNMLKKVLLVIVADYSLMINRHLLNLVTPFLIR